MTMHVWQVAHRTVDCSLNVQYTSNTSFTPKWMRMQYWKKKQNKVGMRWSREKYQYQVLYYLYGTTYLINQSYINPVIKNGYCSFILVTILLDDTCICSALLSVTPCIDAQYLYKTTLYRNANYVPQINIKNRSTLIKKITKRKKCLPKKNCIIYNIFDTNLSPIENIIIPKLLFIHLPESVIM